MSTKQKLGFISVALASAVSAATLLTFCVPVPYRAGALVQEVSDMKEELGAQGNDIDDLKEDVSFIRGYLEQSKEGEG